MVCSKHLPTDPRTLFNSDAYTNFMPCFCKRICSVQIKNIWKIVSLFVPKQLLLWYRTYAHTHYLNRLIIPLYNNLLLFKYIHCVAFIHLNWIPKEPIVQSTVICFFSSYRDQGKELNCFCNSCIDEAIILKIDFLISPWECLLQFLIDIGKINFIGTSLNTN